MSRPDLRWLFAASFDHTTMQVLVGCPSVRFLVENAGSMKDVHFVAFCKLLGLPCEQPFDQYTWDLAKFTCFIARKRNFFRNAVDFGTHCRLTVVALG